MLNRRADKLELLRIAEAVALEKSIDKELIRSMDCTICQASPKEHDKAVSLISHLPIFLASALIEAHIYLLKTSDLSVFSHENDPSFSGILPKCP